MLDGLVWTQTYQADTTCASPEVRSWREYFGIIFGIVNTRGLHLESGYYLDYIIYNIVGTITRKL